MIVGSIAIIFFMLNFKQIVGSDIDIISYFIYGSMVAMPIIIFSDRTLTKIEKQRITVIFILAFFVIFFWGAFEQAGASLTLFADRQTERTIFGWEMPASYFQSVNPLAVIALAPIFSMIWGFLYMRKLEPSSPKKMAIGLTLVALGYVVIAIAVKGLGIDDKVSMWWLIALYLIHTCGELCLSPIGLSMVSKLAPLRLSSLMMGTWFLANAAANKFAGTLSALIPGGEGGTGGSTHFIGFEISNLYEFFVLFIIMTGVAALILFLLSSWLEKRMHNNHVEGLDLEVESR
jgi:proton-dependent oligopeptide transporter, POT family